MPPPQTGKEHFPTPSPSSSQNKSPHRPHGSPRVGRHHIPRSPAGNRKGNWAKDIWPFYVNNNDRCYCLFCRLVVWSPPHVYIFSLILKANNTTPTQVWKRRHFRQQQAQAASTNISLTATSLLGLVDVISLISKLLRLRYDLKLFNIDKGKASNHVTTPMVHRFGLRSILLRLSLMQLWSGSSQMTKDSWLPLLW